MFATEVLILHSNTSTSLSTCQVKRDNTGADCNYARCYKKNYTRLCRVLFVVYIVIEE